MERARAAEAAFGAVVSRESDLDEALPAELRQSDNMYGELTIVETDDPRWIAAMRDYRAADDASEAAFHAVLAGGKLADDTARRCCRAEALRGQLSEWRP